MQYCTISKDFIIILPKESEYVLINAVKYFQDFIKKSFGVLLSVSKKPKDKCKIILSREDKSGNSSKESFRISVKLNEIKIKSQTDRVLAQSLFYIEKLMSFSSFPGIKLGNITRSRIFQRRITTTTFKNMFEIYLNPRYCSNDYFNRMAHFGINGIFLLYQTSAENKA